MVAQARRSGVLHAARWRGGPAEYQPPRAPSRTADGLSASARHPGSVDLWPNSRRGHAYFFVGMPSFAVDSGNQWLVETVLARTVRNTASAFCISGMVPMDT